MYTCDTARSSDASEPRITGGSLVMETSTRNHLLSHRRTRLVERLPCAGTHDRGLRGIFRAVTIIFCGEEKSDLGKIPVAILRPQKEIALLGAFCLLASLLRNTSVRGMWMPQRAKTNSKRLVRRQQSVLGASTGVGGALLLQ